MTVAMNWKCKVKCREVLPRFGKVEHAVARYLETSSFNKEKNYLLWTDCCCFSRAASLTSRRRDARKLATKVEFSAVLHVFLLLCNRCQGPSSLQMCIHKSR